MKRLPIAGLLLVGLFASPLAIAADFDKGLDAYEKGDYETTLREFKPLAEKGDAYAQFVLGQMYKKGEGVLQDDKQAAHWYRLVAEQGNVNVSAEAQYNLGQMYRTGEGVPKNDKEAIKWYRLAARQGLAQAQYNLGVMYYKGKGVPEDNIHAHMWVNIAASAGHDEAKKGHDRLAQYMSKEDIATAQARARECVKSNYKNC